MRKTALSLMLVFGLSSLTFAEMMHKEKTLYQRLGGYDAISAVVKDLAVRLVTDKQLGIYFKGLSNDSKNRLIAHLTDFVCSATGGPCIYLSLIHI